MVTLDPEVAT